MKITVAEARLLKNSVSQKLQDLMRERTRIAYIEFEKGETETPPERTMQQVTDEITTVRKHYRTVKHVLATSNLSTMIDYKDEVISTVEALELVKQLRVEADQLRQFGMSNSVERISRGMYDAKVTYKKALFNPLELKKEAEKMLKEANRLSILIDKSNFNAMVEVDFVDDYQ